MAKEEKHLLKILKNLKKITYSGKFLPVLESLTAKISKGVIDTQKIEEFLKKVLDQNLTENEKELIKQFK